jgi:hypothetical protein
VSAGQAKGTETAVGGLSPNAASLALVAVCLGLGGISLLEARVVAAVHGTPIPWAAVLATTTPRWLLLAAVLPFVLRLACRYPVAPFTLRVGVLHGAVFGALSVAHAIVHAWATGLASPLISEVFSWYARVTRSWLNTMPTLVFIYAAILVAAWGMVEARERQRRTLRAAQLETQLQAARLAALRAQLHPHFLYNTLNGIATLVADTQPARAVAAIGQLGELLHASLREDGRDMVTVDEEVGLAEQYLALQQLRFGRRLHFTLQVSPTVGQCLVPVLLLQPVVENAVVHGLDAGHDRLVVIVTATDTAAGIELRVENDGPDLTTTSRRSTGHGVGLASTRARLETTYGARATMRLEPRAGGGVIVTIRVPRLVSPEPTVPEAVGVGEVG